mgnify:FL=1
MESLTDPSVDITLSVSYLMYNYIIFHLFFCIGNSIAQVYLSKTQILLIDEVGFILSLN